MNNYFYQIMSIDHIEKLLHWGIDYPEDNTPLNFEQKRRIQEKSKKLGFEVIINPDTGKISTDLAQCKKIIDLEMVKKGKQLKRYTLFTTKKQAEEAILFLELFILHLEQTDEIISYYGDKTLDKTWDMLGRLESFKNEIDISKSGSKASLNVMRQKLDRFVTLLPIIEKTALAKKVRKAEKILKKYLG